jgi:hypothetical protein
VCRDEGCVVGDQGDRGDVCGWYEYDVVDSKGRISEKLPVPDYNDIQLVRNPAR